MFSFLKPKQSGSHIAAGVFDSIQRRYELDFLQDARIARLPALSATSSHPATSFYESFKERAARSSMSIERRREQAEREKARYRNPVRRQRSKGE
jgi:hypothetical protein